jgi:hypothetical protein
VAEQDQPVDPFGDDDMPSAQPAAPAQHAAPAHAAQDQPVDPFGDDPAEEHTQTQSQHAAQSAEPKPDYHKAGWGETLGRAWQNLPSDLGNVATSIPQAVMHPGEVWEGVKAAARGAGSYAGLTNGSDEDKAAFDAMAQPYQSVYRAIKTGDTADLKEAIGEKPAQFGMAYAPGVGVAGKALGAGAAGNAVRLASKVLDPIGTTVGAVGSKVVAPVAGAAAHMVTGVEPEVLGNAFKAGRQGGTAGAAFSDFAKGTKGANELSGAARTAMEDLRNDAYSSWKANKSGVMSGSGVVNDVPINDALTAARARIGPRNLALDTAAHDALDRVEQAINTRFSLPQGDPGRGVLGFDQLKQQLWEASRGHPEGSAARNALRDAHAGVRKALGEAAPDYAKLMDEYQTLQDNLNDLTKTLGSGNRVAATAEVKKLVKAQQTPQGRALLQQLAAKNPDLPHMISGAALHGGVSPGLLHTLWDVLGVGGIGHAIVTGNPIGAVAGAGAVLRQHPAISGGAANIAGKLSRPVPGAVADVPGALYQAAPAANRATDELDFGRPQHAAGGKVGHQHLVDRLFSHIEKAKKAERGRTSALLHQPDEHIAKALNAAQAAI